MIKVFDFELKKKKNLNLLLKKNFYSENSFTTELENKISKITNSKYSVCISNWTLGLIAGLKAMGIKNKYVVVPNNTFVASLNSIIESEAIPIICDTDENFNFKYDDLIKILNKYKPYALMIVHLYGFSADISTILKLKNKYKFKIIEDSAQSLFTYNDHGHTGTIGEFGGFSFYGNKIISAGEGGCLITNNKKIFDFVKNYKNHGRPLKGSFIHQNFGLNYCTTDLSSALALDMIREYKVNYQKKKQLLSYYHQYLGKENFFKYPVKSNYWALPFKLNNQISINKFIKYMEDNKIQIRKLFYPLEKQPYVKKIKKIKIIISDNYSKKIYNKVVLLPFSTLMTIEDIKKVSNKIKNFIN